ncbi:AAA family ATPase [Candidatus Ruthia endofausta]|uniref:AAA family ATPase n=1 Tax=Candidatus Ruthia endofausta TaxID=2738852 RepID=UPI001FE35714|nr:AAA family ATPase [Candidatus Ruthia endofausta]
MEEQRRGFLHFGSSTTDEISISLTLKRNKYFARFIKDNENDILIINSDFAGFYSQISEIDYNPSISYNSSESDIKNSIKPIVVKSRDYLKQCKLYHFHDTSEKAKFKSPQDIDNNDFLWSDAGNLAPFLLGLKKDFNDDYQNIVQAVQTVAPYFHDFDLKKDNKDVLLRWQHKNDLEGAGFSANNLSDGTAKFICMVTLFLQPKDMHPKTIVLDEPEIGLHLDALTVLSEIIKAVVNDGSQVIISTQPVTLANCFEPDDFIVVDYENDEFKFERFGKDKQEALKEWFENYQMGTTWEENLLGGYAKMTRLLIPVEGKSERKFVDQILKLYLSDFNVYAYNPQGMKSNISVDRVSEKLNSLIHNCDFVTTLYEFNDLEGVNNSKEISSQRIGKNAKYIKIQNALKIREECQGFNA